MILKAGPCEIVISTDDKGRPTLTPVCPTDEKGKPQLSDELRALNDVFRSEEIVLKPAKIKEHEEK